MNTDLIPSVELVYIAKAISECEKLEDSREREQMIDAIKKIASAAAGAASKRRTNKKADSKRLLLGARLPREIVEKYRAAARITGRSLYSFVSDAVEREYRRSLS